MHQKTDFHPQLIVKNTKTGDQGVTCPNLPGMMDCNGPDEISVVYEGSTVAHGTDFRELEIIGPENAIADLTKCGAGEGENACIFCVVASTGAACERFGKLRWDLTFRTMNAKREPTKSFPDCQLS